MRDFLQIIQFENISSAIINYKYSHSLRMKKYMHDDQFMFFIHDYSTYVQHFLAI